MSLIRYFLLLITAMFIFQLNPSGIEATFSGSSNRQLQTEPDDELKRSLWAEFTNGNEENLLFILKHNQSLIEARLAGNSTPLHLASEKGLVRVVRWLVSNGAAVNVIAYNNFSPLHLTEKSSIARILINAGANLNHRNSFGYTPLQFAAASKHREVVNEILRTGYKLDLLSAILTGRENAVIHLLRDNHLDINRPTEIGGNWPVGESDTPLMIASKYGVKNIVMLLLRLGANPNIFHTLIASLRPSVECLKMLVNKTTTSGGTDGRRMDYNGLSHFGRTLYQRRSPDTQAGARL